MAGVFYYEKGGRFVLRSRLTKKIDLARQELFYPRNGLWFAHPGYGRGGLQKDALTQDLTGLPKHLHNEISG